jgi:hypothetical protein
MTAPSATSRFGDDWLNTPEMRAWLAQQAAQERAKARRRERIERRYR